MKGLVKSIKILVLLVAIFGVFQLSSCDEPLEECICDPDFPYSTTGTDSCYADKDVCEDREGQACFVCL